MLAGEVFPGAGRPFFSVAVPQYVRRRHLELVLASIYAHTSKNFEIIVSDDCSKDDAGTSRVSSVGCPELAIAAAP